jgi:hypothetical protein
MPVPVQRQARRQREQLLVSQYVAENYPTGRVMFQQRVGPIPPTVNESGLTRGQKLALGSFRRVADAVIILPNKLLIIEGYVHVQLGKLSQLLTYIELLPMTPELGAFASLPVEAMLLGAQRDPIMDQMAAKFGIKMVIFQPQWVKDYLLTVDSRKARSRQHVELSLDNG